MGYANILKITNTYRNSQELIDIAGGFIMTNDEQIKKTLKSRKAIKDPILLMSYNDSYEKDSNDKGPFYRLGEAVERAIDDIVPRYGEDKTVLLIGRYNFDGSKLAHLEELFGDKNDKIISKKYTKLDITFLTAHSSKGLGYDNVIVINGKDDVIGFPSKIEDDPVMKLVIKNDESIDYAEERRLFYVALTRTKSQVYIITPQIRTSKFILEIKEKFTNIIIRGEDLNPQETLDYRRKCPKCGYPLQRRKSNLNFVQENRTLWVCSNDPEICGFLTNDIKGGKLSISKCHDCEDGYLIVKPIKKKDGKDDGRRMLGCTNYKNDGTGCNFTMHPQNYTQDKSKISIDFFDPKMSIEKMLLFGMPIKALVDKTIQSMKDIATAYPSFQMSFMTLASFLKGQKNKVIEIYNLDRINNFGMIEEKYSKRVFPLLKELVNHGIIGTITDKYETLILSNDSPDEETIKSIFTNIVFKEH